MLVEPSEKLAPLDSMPRGSGFNDDAPDLLELVFSREVFAREATNPFLAQKVIAYHNSGLAKCLSFLVNYVLYLNFEGGLTRK